jgi:hypothetical protein
MPYVNVYVEDDEFEEQFLDRLRDGEYDEDVLKRAEELQDLPENDVMFQKFHETLHSTGSLTYQRCFEYPCAELQR